MSEREQIKQIIDKLPDYKINRLLIFLQGMQLDDDIEDDLYCEALYQQYLQDPEREVEYSLEECQKEWGLA